MAVAVLVAFAAFLFGAVGYKGLVSLLLLLVGVWTVVAAAAIVHPRERLYYAAWGTVLAILSLTYFVQLRYALGAVLVAIIALIVISAYGSRGTKASSGPTSQPVSPPQGTP